jgi:TetR/AcrR family transcriptional repressor of nem operon
MSKDTKTRILDAAEAIMLEKGFNGVGLNEVLAAVKVPKGSFYHYFPSKEQFGVEILRHYLGEANAYKRRILLSTTPEPDAWLRLATFLEGYIGKSCEAGGKCPCLVIKLASEVAELSDDMRQVLAEGTSEAIGIYQQLLEEAILEGKVRGDLDAGTAAEFIQDVWTGAMHRAQVMRTVEPLRAALRSIRGFLGVPPAQ